MPQTVDIQRVISTSTSNVSVEDLSKKGFKQVKVLNQNVITRLISQAVDQVLEVRAKEINREERDRVIKEARTQFEQLAKDRLEQERSRLDDVQKLNDALFSELETLRSRLSQTIDLQAERDRAQMQLAAVEKDLEQLRARVADQESQLAAARSECAARGDLELELASLRSRTSALETERKTLLDDAARSREQASEKDARIRALEVELAGHETRLEEVEALRRAEAERAAEARRSLQEEIARSKAELASSEDRRVALDAEVERLRGAASEAAANAEEARALRSRVGSLESEVGRRDEALSEIKEKLAETEEGLAAVEAQLTARTEEVARLSSQQANAATMTESLLAALNQRLEQAAKPSADVSEIKLSLDGLSRKLANMAMSQAGFASGGEKELRLDKLFSDSSEGTIESNISKVQIKENKAGDVKGALAKLRKLQGGGGQDGESQR